MTSEKLPALQFYTGDWLKDPGVQGMGFEAKGMWIDMLCLMNESEKRGYLQINNRPISDEVLAKLLRCSVRTLRKLLKVQEKFGVFSRDENGIIFSRRIVKDEHIRQVRSTAGKKGGESTQEQICLSKNDNLLKQNIQAKKGSSSSASSSASNNNILLDENAAFEDFWNDYPEHRKDTLAKKNRAGQEYSQFDHSQRKHLKELLHFQKKVWADGEPQFTPNAHTWLESIRDEKGMIKRKFSRGNGKDAVSTTDPSLARCLRFQRDMEERFGNDREKWISIAEWEAEIHGN